MIVSPQILLLFITAVSGLNIKPTSFESLNNHVAVSSVPVTQIRNQMNDGPAAVYEQEDEEHFIPTEDSFEEEIFWDKEKQEESKKEDDADEPLSESFKRAQDMLDRHDQKVSREGASSLDPDVKRMIENLFKSKSNSNDAAIINGQVDMDGLDNDDDVDGALNVVHDSQQKVLEPLDQQCQSTCQENTQKCQQVCPSFCTGNEECIQTCVSGCDAWCAQEMIDFCKTNEKGSSSSASAAASAGRTFFVQDEKEQQGENESNVTDTMINSHPEDNVALESECKLSCQEHTKSCKAECPQFCTENAPCIQGCLDGCGAWCAPDTIQDCVNKKNTNNPPDQNQEKEVEVAVSDENDAVVMITDDEDSADGLVNGNEDDVVSSNDGSVQLENMVDQERNSFTDHDEAEEGTDDDDNSDEEDQEEGDDTNDEEEEVQGCFDDCQQQDSQVCGQVCSDFCDEHDECWNQCQEDCRVEYCNAAGSSCSSSSSFNHRKSGQQLNKDLSLESGASSMMYQKNGLLNMNGVILMFLSSLLFF